MNYILPQPTAESQDVITGDQLYQRGEPMSRCANDAQRRAWRDARIAANRAAAYGCLGILETPGQPYVDPETGAESRVPPGGYRKAAPAYVHNLYR